MTATLNKHLLEKAAGGPGGKQVQLKPRCHPQSGFRVHYEPGEGVVVLRCTTCDTDATKIMVGQPPDFFGFNHEVTR